MNIAVISYSRVLTSELLKTQRIKVTFVLKWMRPAIYINASMFAQIICDVASPIEVSIRIFLRIFASFAAEVYSLLVAPWKRGAGWAELI